MFEILERDEIDLRNQFLVGVDKKTEVFESGTIFGQRNKGFKCETGSSMMNRIVVKFKSYEEWPRRC